MSRKYEKEYQAYRLNWMIEHGFSIDDLIRELQTHQENFDSFVGVKDLFADWEYNSGFSGELWPCYDEFVDCEINKPMKEDSKARGKMLKVGDFLLCKPTGQPETEHCIRGRVIAIDANQNVTISRALKYGAVTLTNLTLPESELLEYYKKVHSGFGGELCEYNGVLFDDYEPKGTKGDQHNGWACICKHCAENYGFQNYIDDSGPAESLCSVWGCTNEADHYINFDGSEVIKSQSEILKQERFFKRDNYIEEIYYNPDSVSGGQFVHVQMDYDLIRKMNGEYANAEIFFDCLEEDSRQFLSDVGSDSFDDSVYAFNQRPFYTRKQGDSYADSEKALIIAQAVQEEQTTLTDSTEDTAAAVREAGALIQTAAKLGLLYMPDDNSVVVCTRYGDEERWERTNMLEASCSLANSGYMPELKRIVEAKQKELNTTMED